MEVILMVLGLGTHFLIVEQEQVSLVHLVLQRVWEHMGKGSEQTETFYQVAMQVLILLSWVQTWTFHTVGLGRKLLVDLAMIELFGGDNPLQNLLLSSHVHTVRLSRVNPSSCSLIVPLLVSIKQSLRFLQQVLHID